MRTKCEKLCACGCKKPVTRWKNTFIQGHSSKGNEYVKGRKFGTSKTTKVLKEKIDAAKMKKEKLYEIKSMASNSR